MKRGFSHSPGVWQLDQRPGQNRGPDEEGIFTHPRTLACRLFLLSE